MTKRNQDHRAAVLRIKAKTDMAGDWGDHPGRDAILTARILSSSTLDHMRSAALLITAPRIVYAISTCARGALEASAQAAYISSPDISERERIRRYMNMRLLSMHETLRLYDNDERAADGITFTKDRIARILDSGRKFEFSANKGDNRIAPHLDARPPSTMAMIDEAVSSDSNSLGRIYYRSLSSVAHSQAHGLVSYVTPGGPVSDSSRGDTWAAIGATAQEISLRTVGMALGSTTMLSNMVELCAHDPEPARAATARLLTVWGRIADVPFPTQAM